MTEKITPLPNIPTQQELIEAIQQLQRIVSELEELIEGVAVNGEA